MYSRLSEALMRLPPPISLEVERFKLNVAEASGLMVIELSREISPVEIDRVIILRLLRTMKHVSFVERCHHVAPCMKITIYNTFFSHMFSIFRAWNSVTDE